MPPEDVASDLDFRWQAWFQRSDEAVFLLSARRRLVFVNRAWEKATGLLLKEVRGMSCRRRPRRVLAEKTELILGALAPPPEVWKGRSCESRRLLPAIGREASAVIVAYLPLGAGDKLLGVVGVVKPVGDDAGSRAGPFEGPLPEKCLAYRERRRWTLEDWEGDAPALQRLREQIRLAAARPGLPLLIVGERGSGKESLARTIHQLSPWRERFFARLDCERLPPHAVADLLTSVSRRATEGRAKDDRPSPLGVILLQQPSALPRELQAQIAEWLDSEDLGV
ncbi:MAG: sigma 54-interacting transcriptional regulator [Gemmataceae bacterium]